MASCGSPLSGLHGACCFRQPALLAWPPRALPPACTISAPHIGHTHGGASVAGERVGDVVKARSGQKGDAHDAWTDFTGVSLFDDLGGLFLIFMES